MRKQLRWITFILLQFSFAGLITAQTVSGVITDEKGETVIGAHVAEKGTKSAAITDVDGNFTINVKSLNGTLVVSYLGHKTQEVAIKNRNNIRIELESDTKILDELVVTALGIKREKKALGYAIQEVKGEDLTKVRSTNAMGALAGRVAGLQVTGTGTGEWGSTNIVLRGAKSLGNTNQPLIVVDGVPISGGSRGTGDTTGGIDYGSGLSDINPDDIESISVLKGGNAAALYGSRAGNGVILITTKTGKAKKGLGVKYGFDLGLSTLHVLPDLQNTYGRETEMVNGVEQEVLKGTNWTNALMDDRSVQKWNGIAAPFSAQPYNVRDFFQTGVRQSHSLELDGGNETAQARLSVLYSKNKGIIPNSDMDKYNFSFSGGAKVSKRISINGRVSYFIQNTQNRPNLSDSPDNPMYGFLRMPRNIQLNDMKKYQNEDGFPILWDGRASSYSDEISKNQNPYWSVYKNFNNDERNRLIGSLSVNIDVLDNLKVQFRGGTDYIVDKNETRVAKRTAYENNETRSKYAQGWGNSLENNYDYLATYNVDFMDKDLSLVLTYGGSLMHQTSKGISFYGLALSLDDLYTIGNAKNATSGQSFSKKEVQSQYGSASLGYRSFLYLDVTARNDWDSSLKNPDPTKKSDISYFYPSISLSGILTDAFPSIKSDILSYLKLRLSSAQVGNGTSPYRLSYNYTIGPGHLGQQYAYKPMVKPFVSLKPEITTSNEVGVELYLFDNKLRFDGTFYQNRTKNQILSQAIAPSSGYTSKLMNAGLVQNQGVELQLTYSPITKKDMSWDVFVNFSKNRDKIIELLAPTRDDRRVIAGAGTLAVYAMAGGRYGEIYGTKYQRNENGDRIIGSNGLPLLEQNEAGAATENYLGNMQHNFMGGFGTTFKYKGFEIFGLIDARFGGKLYSFTQKIITEYGNAKWTLDGRDDWAASEIARVAAGRTPVEWFNSGNQRGYLAEGVRQLPDGSYTPNRTLYISPQSYWVNAAGVDEEFLYDATFVKLREVRIGYTLPKKWTNALRVSSLQLALVGRNLLYIHKACPDGLDPESSFTGMGFEYSSIPSTREWGFSANISF